MAYIGNMYLGGNDDSSIEIFSSGIAFFLDSENEIDKLFSFSEGWEVELKKGSKLIIARNKSIFSYDMILSNGFEVCQKALDLLSVRYNSHKGIDDYLYNYVALSNENNQFILRYYSLADLSIDIQVSMVHKDKEGKIIEDTYRAEKWYQAFRYYRLSQKSHNVYEAFRNLFLSFECMLNCICKKHNNEGEKHWYERSLEMINNEVPLVSFVPQVNHEYPISFLVNSLYKDTRCKLFHSKEQTIMPYDSFSNKRLVENYFILSSIWEEIVKKYYNISFERSSFTNMGFRTIMDNFANQPIEIVATEDSTVPTEDDKITSPSECSRITFNQSKYEGELEKGHVFFKGVLENKKLNESKRVKKICCLVNGIVYFYSLLPESINLMGVDKFEYFCVIRLLNKNMPRHVF